MTFEKNGNVFFGGQHFPNRLYTQSKHRKISKNILLVNKQVWNYSDYNCVG